MDFYQPVTGDGKRLADLPPKPDWEEEDTKESKPSCLAPDSAEKREAATWDALWAGGPNVRPLGSCSGEMNELADEKNRLKRQKKITEA